MKRRMAIEIPTNYLQVPLAYNYTTMRHCCIYDGYLILDSRPQAWRTLRQSTSWQIFYRYNCLTIKQEWSILLFNKFILLFDHRYRFGELKDDRIDIELAQHYTTSMRIFYFLTLHWVQRKKDTSPKDIQTCNEWNWLIIVR